VVSEDLPLTLFIGVLTTIVMSIVNAAPQLLWIGVVLAPLLTDVLKHWLSRRRWSKRRLLGLTGVLAAGGTVERHVRGEAPKAKAAAVKVAPEPSATAVVTTCLVSSAVTIGAFTTVEAFRDHAVLLDRPTSFLSTQAAAEQRPRRAGYKTPGDAIAATVREQRWAERFRLAFMGRCPAGFTGGMIQRTGALCWFPDPDPGPLALRQLRGNERAFTIGGYSFHEEIWLALEQSAGRWRVARILSPPELPENTGPITTR